MNQKDLERLADLIVAKVTIPEHAFAICENSPFVCNPPDYTCNSSINCPQHVG